MGAHIHTNRAKAQFQRGFSWMCLVILLSGMLLAHGLPLLYVRAQTDFDCGSVTEIPQAECEALVAFYESTDGPHWLLPSYPWLASNTPCSWSGVGCSGGSVVSISLGASCREGICVTNSLAGSIPPEIGDLSSLVTLDLYDNEITSLPPEIGSLSNLTTLHLGSNLIASLPPQIGNLSQLTSLYVFDNQLSSLPSEIGNLTNLIHFVIATNLLTSLPAEIGSLSQLTSLYAGGNQLASLPSQMGNLTNLTTLSLNSNRLTSLPPEIGSLTSLTHLSLSDNLLSSLPPELENLANLIEFGAGNNQLASIPAGLGNVASLESLNFSNNLLASLPPEIGNLTHLRSLDLSYNQLNSLPGEIGNLTSLVFLSLGANQLTSLPIQIGNLSSLTYLYLGENLLASLPPQIGNLTGLIDLYLGGNQLTSLPPELSSLANLTNLYLAHNQLSSLPSTIGDFAKLSHLELTENLLTSLPPEIGKLANLDFLLLSGNLLSSLPPEISHLSRLWYFDLSNNQLSSLDPAVSDLSNLVFIFLANNQLTSLPIELQVLSKLMVLDVGYNRLAITDAGLLSLLSERDPDWADTQTVPPTYLRLVSAAPGSLEFAWTPIRYSTGSGGYELSIATDSGGPFTTHGMTPDKASTSYLAGSLPASGEYYARLRTFSAAGGEQLHDLWSVDSPVLTVLTSPVTPGSAASLELTDDLGRFTSVEVPAGAVTSDGTLYFSTHLAPELPLYLPVSGQAFDLGMYQDGSYHADLPLLAPMTLTLEYEDGDYREEDLRLVVWDAAAVKWIDAARTCSPAGAVDHNPALNRMVVSACRLGTFALVEVWEVSHLPVISRDRMIP